MLLIVSTLLFVSIMVAIKKSFVISKSKISIVSNQNKIQIQGNK